MLGILLIDPQNDFCPGGALAVPNGDKIMAEINTLIAEEHKTHPGTPVFISRDWHPPKMTHHFDTWPVHCVADTPGAEFHPDLEVPEDAIIISKGMDPEGDAYSAFHGRNQGGAPLSDVLKTLQVTDLIVAGLATDYCVKQTVLDALRHTKIRVSLLLSGMRAVNVSPNDGQDAIYEMANAGATLIY